LSVIVRGRAIFLYCVKALFVFIPKNNSRSRLDGCSLSNIGIIFLIHFCKYSSTTVTECIISVEFIFVYLNIYSLNNFFLSSLFIFFIYFIFILLFFLLFTYFVYFILYFSFILYFNY